MTISIQLIGAIGGLLLASNAVAVTITRWLLSRSSERRDTLSQVREALQIALERVARVEGRADELSRQNSALQTRLSDERVEAARKIADLSIRIAQLEHDLEEARAENDELRGRVRHRATTPATPIAAQPDTTERPTDDAPPRR